MTLYYTYNILVPQVLYNQNCVLYSEKLHSISIEKKKKLFSVWKALIYSVNNTADILLCLMTQPK